MVGGLTGYFLAVTNVSAIAQPFSFYMNGTVNGTNSGPVVISAPGVSADGSSFVFTVSGTAGLTYRVLVSPSLAAGSWLEYTNYVQTTPTQTVILPIDKNYPAQFYRITSP